MPDLIPSRPTGVARLTAFVPVAGRAYANSRNTDSGPDPERGQLGRPNVSVLSPYVRHRLVSEPEIISAVLARHSPSAAEKLIQEVCWRTYWKGWLEMRPQVWRNYLDDVRLWQSRLSDDPDLAAALARAERGETGIACFDAWARELVETGYLHNHARMWFASIWTHTLDLPWQLGADFFMRHLLDGDPASNTLSWRWVVGLQTAGKVYLARASNIATYTNGRFDPRGQLVEHAEPLTDDVPLAKPVKPVAADPPPAEGPVMLIVTEDDLTPEQWLLGAADVVAVVGLRTADAYPGSSEAVVRFKQGALADAMARSQAHFGAKAMVLPVAAVDTLVPVIRSFAASSGARAIATMGCPVGPTADRIAPVLRGLADDGSVPIHVMRRPWDDLFWPHATAGFFKLKEQIPSVLSRLDLGRQAELALK